MTRAERAGAVFLALADPTRREVLGLVGERGPLSATELAAELPVSRQAVAKHLDALNAAGLVAAAREGRAVRFSVAPEALDDAVSWMVAVGDRWDRRLVALHARAEARARQK
ncbi:MAG: metalloregulator ArsR/SmtB family transcription factor [Acidimicrobiales bacterium]